MCVCVVIVNCWYEFRAIISVEGYDTCLPEEDIKSELTNHFNSCGEVFNVIVRKDPDSPNLDRFVCVSFDIFLL